MGPALAAADLVVTRAGTNTLAELAALGKPTIVIPGSQLHDQTSNATTLARTGAVRVINEEKLSPALLTHEIEGVLASPEAQAALEKGIRTFAVHDAADQLAELILYVGGEGSA
jgi:UDP-N-acetylglucosamine--N-acetylmuramyl-(pentapeptide) pyrophosphoryl-undecaprenol N-acetylglucosamine transferase